MRFVLKNAEPDDRLVEVKLLQDCDGDLWLTLDGARVLMISRTSGRGYLVPLSSTQQTRLRELGILIQAGHLVVG